MPKNLSFNIKETFTGIYRAIAEKANLNGDEKLEGIEEISLFYEAKRTIDPKTNSVFVFDGKLYDKNGKETHETPIIAKNDAIQMPKVYEIENNNLLAESINVNAVETIDSYMKDLSPEQIKKLKLIRENRKKTYDYALSHIENDKLSDQEKEALAKKMTSLVLEKCEIYDAIELAPVIIQILKIECGFDFSKKTLAHKVKTSKDGRNHGGFVGSGQCTYQTIGVCVNTNDSTLAEKDMHKNYLSGYDKEIDALKARYGQTKAELWELAKTDGSLGVEIAILTILNNLTWLNKKHDVKLALSRYGGAYTSSNKKLDFSIMPSTFTPRPKVSKK